MFPRFLSRLGLAALILTGVVTACGDENTATGPRSFRVTLEVTDPDGRAVSGLELGMAPDTPWYVDGRVRPFGASAVADQLQQPFPSPSTMFSIPFRLDVTSRISLTIEDVEETTVRRLVDGQVESGAQTAVWDGRDDAGALMPSGVYTAHLVARDLGSETVRLNDSRRVLLAVFDRMTVGTTDQRGRIVLEEKRLFPFLYDVPDMPAVDENGATVGTISLGSTVRFYFTDPASGFTRRYDRDVAGPATLSFVWSPPPVK